MGVRPRRVAALLLSLVLAAGPAAAQPPFRHGIGVHDPLNWGTLVPGRPDRYADRPFDDADHAVPEVLLRAVAEAGFDFVRLTLDPGPFLQLEGPAREALDAKLLAVVARMHRLGLGVVVDLHANAQVPAYDAQAIIASGDAPVFRAYVALVARTARLLAGLKRADVAFELMNEPPYGYDPESRRRWQGMVESLHAAARREAPDLTLVLSGAHGGDREGLLALDPAPFRGSRVLWSFHYYEPHDFTHQGVPEEGAAGRYRRYLSGLPYPAGVVPRARVEAGVAANIDADPDLGPLARAEIRRQAAVRIGAYLRTDAGPGVVARDFDRVADWAARHAIPGDRIFLGEFGATRSYDDHRAADAPSYEGWIGDVRRAAEARGFGWAIWALTGTGGMALVETDGGTRLDAGSLCALGLRCR